MVRLLFEAETVQLAVLEPAPLDAGFFIYSLAHCYLLVETHESFEVFEVVEPGLVDAVVDLARLEELLVAVDLLDGDPLVLVEVEQRCDDLAHQGIGGQFYPLNSLP